MATSAKKKSAASKSKPAAVIRPVKETLHQPHSLPDEFLIAGILAQRTGKKKQLHTILT